LYRERVNLLEVCSSVAEDWSALVGAQVLAKWLLNHEIAIWEKRIWRYQSTISSSFEFI